MEAKTLCSEVIILSSGGQVESAEGWLGTMRRDPEKNLVSSLGVQVASRGG